MIGSVRSITYLWRFSRRTYFACRPIVCRKWRNARRPWTHADVSCACAARWICARTAIRSTGTVWRTTRTPSTARTTATGRERSGESESTAVLRTCGWGRSNLRTERGVVGWRAGWWGGNELVRGGMAK